MSSESTRASSRISLNSARNDLWIREVVFPGMRNGYFVEAGAADGFTESSCYLLERELSWTGLCIEPSPRFFPLLMKRRSKSRCENVCLAGSERKVAFVLGGSGFLSGIRENLLTSKWKGEDVVRTGQEIQIDAFPLATLLRRHNAPKIIDYAAFDIEGSELEVLEAFPFDEYHFRAISLESDSRVEAAIADVLRPNGYRRVTNPLNRNVPWEHYWVDEATAAALPEASR